MFGGAPGQSRRFRITVPATALILCCGPDRLLGPGLGAQAGPHPALIWRLSPFLAPMIILDTITLAVAQPAVPADGRQVDHRPRV